jgi:hypothetical protein
MKWVGYAAVVSGRREYSIWSSPAFGFGPFLDLSEINFRLIGILLGSQSLG